MCMLNSSHKANLIFITPLNDYTMKIELFIVMLCNKQYDLHSSTKQTINVVCISCEANSKPFKRLNKSMAMHNGMVFHLSPIPFRFRCVQWNASSVTDGTFEEIGLANIFIIFRKRVNKLKTYLLNKNYSLHLTDWIIRTIHEKCDQCDFQQ